MQESNAAAAMSGEGVINLRGDITTSMDLAKVLSQKDVAEVKNAAEAA